MTTMKLLIIKKHTALKTLLVLIKIQMDFRDGCILIEKTCYKCNFIQKHCISYRRKI